MGTPGGLWLPLCHCSCDEERVSPRALLVPWWLVLELTACRRAAVERAWSACKCEYVTDFDQPGHVSVEVCSTGAERSPAAKSCAQSLGVGAVVDCACTASRGPCEERDRCRELER
ncbi:MAG TPA: hypothetical protein VJT73_15435 [Polyangiaceae bacterium]|nr:hypothetical protein [Polyangiaceae bacterium]